MNNADRIVEAQQRLAELRQQEDRDIAAFNPGRQQQREVENLVVRMELQQLLEMIEDLDYVISLEERRRELERRQVEGNNGQNVAGPRNEDLMERLDFLRNELDARQEEFHAIGGPLRGIPPPPHPHDFGLLRGDEDLDEMFQIIMRNAGMRQEEREARELVMQLRIDELRRQLDEENREREANEQPPPNPPQE
ncbi:Protein CBG25696 [Caenorhabditis briggsae]|uniref:Uncharacterized protein n=2 Tax=Caenorhabditis briggsae TaxID=6238 RepID=A0AAE9IVV5_CAEBR|nr:Protein CBG25696 [Caenorhabditis briggsae]ULU08035.1 hypothetical protein L3Y34_019245 [Caenorhabditis briggsae]UMM19970.1 hypothetical protein L5515_015368 [Caenorhabditis briggsae]CAS00482.1 Protein CBG25696 [Caenorhabditis briggsae]